MKCVLCYVEDENEVTGALSTKDDVTAHQNCLVSDTRCCLFFFFKKKNKVSLSRWGGGEVSPKEELTAVASYGRLITRAVSLFLPVAM